MRADARQIIFTMPSPMDCVKPSTRKTEAILDTGTQSGQDLEDDLERMFGIQHIPAEILLPELHTPGAKASSCQLTAWKYSQHFQRTSRQELRQCSTWRARSLRTTNVLHCLARSSFRGIARNRTCGCGALPAKTYIAGIEFNMNMGNSILKMGSARITMQRCAEHAMPSCVRK